MRGALVGREAAESRVRWVGSRGGDPQQRQDARRSRDVALACEVAGHCALPGSVDLGQDDRPRYFDGRCALVRRADHRRSSRDPQGATSQWRWEGDRIVVGSELSGQRREPGRQRRGDRERDLAPRLPTLEREARSLRQCACDDLGPRMTAMRTARSGIISHSGVEPVEPDGVEQAAERVSERLSRHLPPAHALPIGVVRSGSGQDVRDADRIDDPLGQAEVECRARLQVSEVERCRSGLPRVVLSIGPPPDGAMRKCGADLERRVGAGQPHGDRTTDGRGGKADLRRDRVDAFRPLQRHRGRRESIVGQQPDDRPRLHPQVRDDGEPGSHRPVAAGARDHLEPTDDWSGQALVQRDRRATWCLRRCGAAAPVRLTSTVQTSAMPPAAADAARRRAPRRRRGRAAQRSDPR